MVKVKYSLHFAAFLIQGILSFSFERTMDPSKAHYTLSHGQVAHVDKSEPDINVTVATSRVPSEMTVQGQRCAGILNPGKSHCWI